MCVPGVSSCWCMAEAITILWNTSCLIKNKTKIKEKKNKALRLSRIDPSNARLVYNFEVNCSFTTVTDKRRKPI